MDLAAVARSSEKTRPTRRRRPPRERRARASAPGATDVVKATREMRSLVQVVESAVEALLFPALESLESEYIRDASIARAADDFSDDLQAIVDRIRGEQLVLTARRAQVVSENLTARTNQRNRDRFYSSIEDVVGIDLSAVADESGLTPILKLKTSENVGLIKSIPEDYFNKVERLVFENVIQGRTSAKSMIEELREIGVKTDARARFIARDQTSKLNAALNRERNQALGITEYIWRTSKDERVRDTHRRKEGKKFRWDKPPADTGHPGEDFQCRCRAFPVIVV